MARKRYKKPVRPEGWHSWQGIIQRCENSSSCNYKRYGGSGISVCDRWRHSFADFISDMGPRPSSSHSVDRYPNKNGNYEPGNCRWATMKEQNNNRTNNRILTFNGKSQTMSQWADEIGITIYALHGRLQSGRMTLEEALTFQTPHIEYDGKRMSATAWAKAIGIKADTIQKRIKKGWTAEETLTTPVRDWGRSTHDERSADVPVIVG